MANWRFKVVYYICHFICTSATIGFTCFCIHKYFQNEDVSQVTSQEFHKEKDNLYPSVTICTSSIFYDENLQAYGDGVNVSTYSDFMAGKYWDDRLVEVDYDKVTLNFSKYLLGVGMWTADWSNVDISQNDRGREYFLYDHRMKVKHNTSEIGRNTVELNKWTPYFYHSYRAISQKCFTVDIPYTPLQKVWTFGVVFDGDVFPNGIRPSYYEFGVKVHYPGQFLDSKMEKYVWNDQIWGLTPNSSEYLTMRFQIQKMEVMKNRNTMINRCHAKWMEQDTRIMFEKLGEVGCRPPWWKYNEDFPVCRSKDTVKMFQKLNLTNYTPACQSIQKILYTYQEFEGVEDWTQEWLDEANSIFEVLLEFQDGTYIEIQRIRAYSIQDLVGDMGGYLGLFLGFAFLQIPELSLKICVWIDIALSKRKHGTSHVSEMLDIEEAHVK